MSIAYRERSRHPWTPPWRHVPPTAFPVRFGDLWAGVVSLVDGRSAGERLCTAIGEWTGGRDCLLVGSARAALAVILTAVRRGSRRTRVVVPAYTCPTVVQSVLAAGLEPVFCDVSPDTLDFEGGALERVLDRTVLAVIATHLYGWAQDVRPLLPVAHDLGVCVVEDAAQAFGATLARRAVGTWGDVGFYSLGHGKCVPAGGGGIVVSQPHWGGTLAGAAREMLGPPARRGVGPVARLAAYAAATRPFGWWFVARSPLNPAREGDDAEQLPALRFEGLSPASAAIGAAMIGRLQEVQETRRRTARRLMAALSECEGIAVPRVAPGAEPVFLRLPLVVDSAERAERLFRALDREGLGVSCSYRHTVPDMYSRRLPSQQPGYPGADRLASCLLTLPTHPFVRDVDIDHICATIRADTNGGAYHARSAAR